MSRSTRAKLPRLAVLLTVAVLAAWVSIPVDPRGAWAAEGENPTARLRNGQVRERREAALWLSEHGDPAAVPALVAALRDDDRAVRRLSERALWSIWTRSGNPAVDHFLEVGVRFLTERRFDEALEAFDKVVAADREFPEGYNKRATALYYLGQYRRSMEDIQETLKRNPYHFGALSGAGLCMIGLDEPAAALSYFEQALEINPDMPDVQRMVATLRRQLNSKIL